MIKLYSLTFCIFNALIIFDKSDATLCKPHSPFKIDCNDCMCSSDGTQYTCTEKLCFKPPSVFHQEDDTYTLPERRTKRDNDNDIYMVDDGERVGREASRDDNDDVYLINDDNSRSGRAADDSVFVIDDLDRNVRDTEPMVIITDDGTGNRLAREVYMVDDEDGGRVARDAEVVLVQDDSPRFTRDTDDGVVVIEP